MGDLVHNTAIAECSISSSNMKERQTRISFELHPSLILEDLIFEGLFDGDGDDEAGIEDFFDLLEDNLRAHSNSPCGVADADVEGTIL